jgi:hypothetical protein
MNPHRSRQGLVFAHFLNGQPGMKPGKIRTVVWGKNQGGKQMGEKFCNLFEPKILQKEGKSYDGR